MIGFIGGTGPEGRGLALRFALAGEMVLIGSRDEGRANEAAKSLAGDAPPGSVRGKANADVAHESDIVFIAVPYSAQRQTLEGLKVFLLGKLVVNVIAPLVFEKGKASAVRVDAGSAAEEARDLLPESTIVAAFQNISAQKLLVPDQSLDTDVVVCADDSDAKQKVMALAEAISGVRAVDGGGLANARYVEGLTALLLNINRIYKANSMIKIVGI